MASGKRTRKASTERLFDVTDDPVVAWADSVAADETRRGEETYEDFLRLRKHYATLLRRFEQVTRLSDSIQEDLKLLTDSLYEAARKDPLTGLSNRREMLESLATQIRRAERHNEVFSVVLADIDHFKAVNDQHGHEAGDIVLIHVAHQLEQSVREEDLCARWGGEEFLICLPHVALAGATSVAEKLRQRIDTRELSVSGSGIHVTASLGVATYQPGDEIDTLVRIADGAMFEAKRRGRNQVYVMDGR